MSDEVGFDKITQILEGILKKFMFLYKKLSENKKILYKN